VVFRITADKIRLSHKTAIKVAVLCFKIYLMIDFLLFGSAVNLGQGPISQICPPAALADYRKTKEQERKRIRSDTASSK